MLFNTFFGCIVFLITNTSLIYTSHLLVRRFLPNAPPSVRLVAIGLSFYSLIILIFQALSPFHAISRTWVTISCLLLASVSHFIWGNQRNLQADLEPIRSWIREGLTSRWAALLIICGFVVLLSLSCALLMPPLAWDCLTYHLTFAALWIKKGTLLLFKAPDKIQCAHFPINGEIFASWLLLPFHNDLMVNTMNFPITLLGGISCYAIARELGLTRKEASFAPALICFAPVIYSQITTEYLDSAVFTFCSASVLFTLRYLRRGNLYDGLLSLVAVGILLGIKYTGIPVVGLIFLATTIKTISLVRHSGLFKKLGLILLGLIILCTLGGRQYIRNTIEAGNPFYPLTVKISHHEIFEGWSKQEQMNEWVSEYEKGAGLDKYSLWEREYRKFCYKTLTGGPKFLLFLILALISLFTRPKEISKEAWYFLAVMWIIPIVLYYADTSANAAREGPWIDLSVRYLSPYIALFTIQGLVVIQKISKHFRKIDFFLMALVAWDLLHVRKTHIWEVAVLYPFIILIIPLIITLFNLVLEKSKLSAPKEEAFCNSYGSNSPQSVGWRKLIFKHSLISTIPSRLCGTITKQWAVYALGFIVLIGGLYFLQKYRDNTRYTYYRGHLDLHSFPRNFVNGWEFLDQPDEKSTIAMTMGWKPPGGKWFLYPLLGRCLQNDIVYISAKYKWEVPTWFHRGLLRGNDFSIWLYNLKKKKVNYILVQTPWPIELRWIQRHQDEFQLVFSDKNCKIFKYIGEGA